MRILALETSTEWCSVAVGDGTRWHRRDERAGHAHSERLLPMVDAALAEAGWSLRDLDGIAFGAGPGSFTGIRIGCGVAQGLALGAGLPVVPVPTLAAIAQEVCRARGWNRVIACLDARMREVYVAAYARDGGGWREVAAPTVGPPGDVARPVSPAHMDWAGAGNGFAVYPALAAQLALDPDGRRCAPDGPRDRRARIAAARRGRGRGGGGCASGLRASPHRADDRRTRSGRQALRHRRWPRSR